MIHDILYNSCEVIGDLKDAIVDEIYDNEEEYTIDDEIMSEIVAKVKYNMETLGRYLWWY